MCSEIKVITNLCVLGFDNVSREMQVESLHPGITPLQVKENSGFDISINENVKQTDLPTMEELQLLRNNIDPNRLYI
jgi:glutaconate CoA-transferase subunit B